MARRLNFVVAPSAHGMICGIVWLVDTRKSKGDVEAIRGMDCGPHGCELLMLPFYYY